MLNSEPHIHYPVSSLEEFSQFRDNKSSLETLSTLIQEYHLVEEKGVSGGFKTHPQTIIIGHGSMGKSMGIHHHLMEAMLQSNHNFEIKYQKEMSEEVLLEKQKLLLNFDSLQKKKEDEENKWLLQAPIDIWDDEEMIINNHNSGAKKCRIKDTTKSLSKRRAKNKIARKSKQKNRK